MAAISGTVALSDLEQLLSPTNDAKKETCIVLPTKNLIHHQHLPTFLHRIPVPPSYFPNRVQPKFTAVCKDLFSISITATQQVQSNLILCLIHWFFHQIFSVAFYVSAVLSCCQQIFLFYIYINFFKYFNLFVYNFLTLTYIYIYIQIFFLKKIYQLSSYKLLTKQQYIQTQSWPPLWFINLLIVIIRGTSDELTLIILFVVSHICDTDFTSYSYYLPIIKKYIL